MRKESRSNQVGITAEVSTFVISVPEPVPEVLSCGVHRLLNLCHTAG
jgi:hypothetical protein